MAKNFKNNLLGKLNDLPAADPEIDSPAAGQQAAEPEKRKPGRPKVKTEDTKTINIAVPVSVLTKMDIAKTCYGNNLTQYVNAVINRDLAANYDEYENIYNSLNNFK